MIDRANRGRRRGNLRNKVSKEQALHIQTRLISSASSGMPPDSCGRLPSEISKGLDGGGMHVQASMPRLDRWRGRSGRPALVKARLSRKSASTQARPENTEAC